MNEILAKLKYGPNSFEVLEKGNHVICAVSGKKFLWINLPIGMLICKKPIFHLKKHKYDLKN